MSSLCAASVVTGRIWVGAMHAQYRTGGYSGPSGRGEYLRSWPVAGTRDKWGLKARGEPPPVLSVPGPCFSGKGRAVGGDRVLDEVSDEGTSMGEDTLRPGPFFSRHKHRGGRAISQWCCTSWDTHTIGNMM